MKSGTVAVAVPVSPSETDGTGLSDEVVTRFAHLPDGWIDGLYAICVCRPSQICSSLTDAAHAACAFLDWCSASVTWLYWVSNQLCIPGSTWLGNLGLDISYFLSKKAGDLYFPAPNFNSLLLESSPLDYLKSFCPLFGPNPHPNLDLPGILNNPPIPLNPLISVRSLLFDLCYNI